MFELIKKTFRSVFSISKYINKNLSGLFSGVLSHMKLPLMAYPTLNAHALFSASRCFGRPQMTRVITLHVHLLRGLSSKPSAHL